jgi:hypothetical protein
MKCFKIKIFAIESKEVKSKLGAKEINPAAYVVSAQEFTVYVAE